jgi:DNA modification methylase
MTNTIIGDCRQVLPTLEPQSVHTCVTSPPYYGLRDYGIDNQIGLEDSPEEYIANLVTVFRLVRHVPRDDGTLWLNLGDSYGGGTRTTNVPHKISGKRDLSTSIRPKGLNKQLIGIPWRTALALQADGWCLRADIIWSKTNVMPNPVSDRPLISHEYIFLLAKNEHYYYDIDATRTPHKPNSLKRYETGINRSSPDDGSISSGANNPRSFNNAAKLGDNINPKGANLRSVWTIPPSTYRGAHFATFPPKLIEPCILAGCPPNGTVLDPFAGSGTTAATANSLGRNAIAIELQPNYAPLIKQRLTITKPLPGIFDQSNN